MPRNHFIIPTSLPDNLLEQEIAIWIEESDFWEALFDDGKYTCANGEIYHSILEKPGFKTYLADLPCGTLAVFEIKIEEGRVEVECYSPLLIFYFIRKELAFERNPGFFTNYLSDGYQLMSDFRAYFEGMTMFDLERIWKQRIDAELAELAEDDRIIDQMIEELEAGVPFS